MVGPAIQSEEALGSRRMLTIFSTRPLWLCTGSAERTEAKAIAERVYSTPGGAMSSFRSFLIRNESQDLIGVGSSSVSREEREQITLKFAKLTDLWREDARDAKTLAACARYNGLKAEGKLRCAGDHCCPKRETSIQGCESTGGDWTTIHVPRLPPTRSANR